MMSRTFQSNAPLLVKVCSGRAFVITCLVLFYLSGALVQSAHAAEESHIFDAALSLTGNCETTTLDPVPDPGSCPGVAGVDHPKLPFSYPEAVTTDFYGDIFIANYGPEENHGIDARIDVFGPSGRFITEVADPQGPGSIAVDSEGNLYVDQRNPVEADAVVRYKPSIYDPQADKIAYGNPPVAVEGRNYSLQAIAINPSNDHLFVDHFSYIEEYSSAAEGNRLLPETIELVEGSGALTVDAAHNRIYAANRSSGGPGSEGIFQAFSLTPPHGLLFTVKGADVPAGEFGVWASVAADEGTGRFFIYNEQSKQVYEFASSGSYLATIERGFGQIFQAHMAVDNGRFSTNGALNPYGRYLFVPSNEIGLGHVYAFGPKVPPRPPVVKSLSVGGVTEDEAVLHGVVNPEGLETAYRFEYVTQEAYEQNGGSFTGASVAGEGSLPAGREDVAVTADLAGLSPGVDYRVRLVAVSEQGEVVREETFGTYDLFAGSSGCANEALRIDASAGLADCRAYELVTPVNTNGHAPLALNQGSGQYFATRASSADGNVLSFVTLGGAIPGFEGTSSFFGDSYRATRGPDGWGTVATGPNGAQAPIAIPGSSSVDQGYQFWEADSGPDALEGKNTVYLRYPDGHSEPVGRGSLGRALTVRAELISQDAGHVIFETEKPEAVSLEPQAPPSGTRAVYDRTRDPQTGAEETHVVSLLPGDVTPAAGQGAGYQGASLDGKGVAFTIGSKLYLRYDDTTTYEVADGVTFMGVMEGGSRVFYVQGGDLYRFDATSGERTRFTESGNITPVIIAGGGTVAYFVSPSVLNAGASPGGRLPVAGENNLYRSDEGSLSFLGTVTEEDMQGQGTLELTGEGLGNGIAVAHGEPGLEAAHSTPDGRVLLFVSRAQLTGYDPEGHPEVYRYDATSKTLACVSCNPTGHSNGEASLQSSADAPWFYEPLSRRSIAGNLRDDGKRVFFQSTEALVPGDVDGVQDVYEWEAGGVGSCRTAGGCVYLVSSGGSADPNYLVGSSDSGDDVFFRTSDLLVGEDGDETVSIYDARVNGGFAAKGTGSGECLGEACQPAPQALTDLTPSTLAFHGAGNIEPATHAEKRHRKHRKPHKQHNRRKHRGARRGRRTGQRNGRAGR